MLPSIPSMLEIDNTATGFICCCAAASGNGIAISAVIRNGNRYFMWENTIFSSFSVLWERPGANFTGRSCYARRECVIDDDPPQLTTAQTARQFQEPAVFAEMRVWTR